MMDKLREFGRNAIFYVRVLSGYEERRIRSYRLALQKKIAEAEKRKEAIRKMPEQLILSEVRQMVEKMQEFNKQLEDTEAAINEYFKPIDKQAEIIMEMQLQKEESSMKQMLRATEAQALLQKEAAERNVRLKAAEAKPAVQDKSSTTSD